MKANLPLFAALFGFVLPLLRNEGENLLPRCSARDDAPSEPGMPADERWEDWS